MHGTTELIASLDLGTTSARAIIFNAEGRPLAASQKPPYVPVCQLAKGIYLFK